MHPKLFEFGPLTLHAYGFMLALSFFFGILLASRRAPARGVHPDVVFDTALAIVFASIVGARLMYVLYHREEMQSFVDVIAVWRGGLTMYGGILGGIAAAWWFVRRRGVPFLRMADIMAPSLGLGLMLTRVGCFLNGCCYGKPTESAFGVQFPPTSVVGQLFEGTAIHPTQLYSAFAGLAVLVTLLLFDRSKRPEGQVFALYLVLAGAGRFVLDFYRFYEANVYVVGEFTVNQLISVGLMAVGVLLWIATRKRPSAQQGAQRSRSGSPGAATTARSTP